MSTMKWKKLGKIFDPTEYQLPNNCVQFAQAPQALVFDDFVRIYFSTRSIDEKNGKYLSHIAYVDMKKNLRDVIRVSEKTVIPLGGLGCFDEHGIFPMSVMRHGDAIYAYTCGWNRRVSVSVDTAIGLAISLDDGLTFQRIGDGPVLAASLHEPCLVGDGQIRIKDRFGWRHRGLRCWLEGVGMWHRPIIWQAEHARGPSCARRTCPSPPRETGHVGATRRRPRGPSR